VRGAIAPPQHGGSEATPPDIFEIFVAKSCILMHFASNITESVSLKIFSFWLLVTLVNCHLLHATLTHFTTLS